MSSTIDRETYVNVSKFIMNNSDDNDSYNLDNGIVLRQFYYKDLMFSYERLDGKIRPQYIEFECCGDKFQIHTDGNFKQEFFNTAAFEVAIDDDSVDDVNEDDFYMTTIIDDPTIVNILSSFVKWRFNVLLKTKF